MGLVTTICEKLGKANEPVYAVAAVAVFKGIFRPLFTMQDKEQDPETKKYAAIREGATELIAIPTYLTLSWAVQKLAPAFAADKTIPRTLEHSKRTLGFLGVCFAALYAIPKLCNITMPHLMKFFKLEAPEKTPKKETLTPLTPFKNPDNTQKDFKYIYPKTSINTGGGMKI